MHEPKVNALSRPRPLTRLPSCTKTRANWYVSATHVTLNESEASESITWRASNRLLHTLVCIIKDQRLSRVSELH